MPHCDLALVVRLFMNGFSIREVARLADFSSITASRYLNVIEAAKGPLKCMCGGPIRHQGWCRPRYRRSAMRQAWHQERRNKGVLMNKNNKMPVTFTVAVQGGGYDLGFENVSLDCVRLVIKACTESEKSRITNQIKSDPERAKNGAELKRSAAAEKGMKMLANFARMNQVTKSIQQHYDTSTPKA